MQIYSLTFRVKGSVKIMKKHTFNIIATILAIMFLLLSLIHFGQQHYIDAIFYGVLSLCLGLIS